MLSGMIGCGGELCLDELNRFALCKSVHGSPDHLPRGLRLVCSPLHSPVLLGTILFDLVEEELEPITLVLLCQTISAIVSSYKTPGRG